MPSVLGAERRKEEKNYELDIGFHSLGHIWVPETYAPALSGKQGKC